MNHHDIFVISLVFLFMNSWMLWNIWQIL